MRVEYRVNSRTNYAISYCETCEKELGKEDAGLEMLAPAQIATLEKYINDHRRRNFLIFKHKSKIVVHNRLPTEAEIRVARPKKFLGHTNSLPITKK